MFHNISYPTFVYAESAFHSAKGLRAVTVQNSAHAGTNNKHPGSPIPARAALGRDDDATELYETAHSSIPSTSCKAARAAEME